MFHATSPYQQPDLTASYLTEEPETGSLLDTDPFDFSCYMDQVRQR